MNLVGANLPPYQRLGLVLGHTLGRYLQGGHFNEALSLVLMASSDSTCRRRTSSPAHACFKNEARWLASHSNVE